MAQDCKAQNRDFSLISMQREGSRKAQLGLEKEHLTSRVSMKVTSTCPVALGGGVSGILYAEENRLLTMRMDLR